MVTETHPVQRIPLYLGSLAIGLLLAFLVGDVFHTTTVSSAVLAVFPFALAALVGVAKSATP